MATYTKPIHIVTTHQGGGSIAEYLSVFEDGPARMDMTIYEESFPISLPGGVPAFLPYKEYWAVNSMTLAGAFPRCVATNIGEACRVWGLTLSEDHPFYWPAADPIPVMSTEMIHTCKCGWQTPYPIVCEGVYVCQSCKMMKEMY